MCAAERQICHSARVAPAARVCAVLASVLHAASTFLARHFFCLWLAVLLVGGLELVRNLRLFALDERFGSALSYLSR